MNEGNGNNYCTCATVLALPSGHSILAGSCLQKEAREFSGASG